MKLEKFDTKKKTKNYIIAGISVVLIAVIGVIIYKSYALYQEEKTFNVLQGKIGNFGASGDIQLAYTIDGEESSGYFPLKTSRYTAESVTCENGATAEWDNDNWALTNINSGNNNSLSCNINFTESTPAKCKRATTLHTEVCTSNSYDACRASIGYENVIRYGSLGTNGILTSGDAFDCDVNGDGIYDAETERFYYVSDYFRAGSINTDSGFDSDYAVLIYYSNTANGEATNSVLSAYDSQYTTGADFSGPLTAMTQLPTTEQWSNISLKNSARTITQKIPGYAAVNTAYNVSYEGYAARLITYQELVSACGDEDDTAVYKMGYLDACNYMLENTYYSITINNGGYWIENRHNATAAWAVRYNRTLVYDQNFTVAKHYGVRPAIEVAKTDISY